MKMMNMGREKKKTLPVIQMLNQKVNVNYIIFSWKIR